MAQVQRKVCLIVIDGWGISENKEGDKFFFVYVVFAGIEHSLDATGDP